MAKSNSDQINIVIPMSGEGKSFIQAGYTFPKPLIDINGKPMVQIVLENLTPKYKHKFILVCKKEHFDKYSMHQVFVNSIKGDFITIPLISSTQGALCSVLNAVDQISSNQELVIANADQIIDIDINKFIDFARKSKADGVIMTFKSHHPRWSYARVDEKGIILETAEKKVISDQATVGIYYFKAGSSFMKAAFSMIEKNIRFNNDFYVCPVYNELILEGKKIIKWEIKDVQMHGLGTPEDLNSYLNLASKKRK
ncbi:MAG: glycosyltransferase family 2 protein [Patescibacteria group bacterium]